MTKKESKPKLGRPTKYDEKLQRKADEYVDSCSDYEQLPTIEGLAEVLKINADTVQEWSKSNDIFSVTVKKIRELQKKRLMEKGLDQSWSTPMAIFLLKANHGLVDKVVNINVDSPESKVEALLHKMGE